MKKYILSILLLLITVSVFAQDRNSEAFKAGYMVGRILAYVLVAALVIWGIWRLTKKK